MNPAEWLRATARINPSAPALFRGEELVATYEEFSSRAASIAGALNKRNIGKGDRVAILMKNCTQYLEAMYGIWWSGAAAVPINAKLHAREAAWIIENAGAELVFASIAEQESLQNIKPDCVKEIISAQTPQFDALYKAEPMPAPQPIGSDDLIWLFYTSGTTGRPKGVMITSGNIQAMILGYSCGIAHHAPEDASLYAAPLSHGAGIYNFMHVIAGSRHVCPVSGGFDEAEILDLAPKIGRISMFAAPTMVHRLVNRAKATGQTGEGLDTIIYAGGPMYFADIVEAVDVMGDRFAQIYGQGECPMAITILQRRHVSDRTHERWKERLTSVGIAQMVSRIRVVDADGNDLETGEIGEIVVAGNAVMAGYWNNPEATAETIHDGWLMTGDMGALDEEGFLTLHDRSKDMIISGGSNIYPREVEEVLLLHPKVAEASVVGRKHEEWGEIVVACIVPSSQDNPEPAELDQICIDNIARFKRPKEYLFMESLPKNNYGKVVKRELRKMVDN